MCYSTASAPVVALLTLFVLTISSIRVCALHSSTSAKSESSPPGASFCGSVTGIAVVPVNHLLPEQ